MCYIKYKYDYLFFRRYAMDFKKYKVLGFIISLSLLMPGGGSQF